MTKAYRYKFENVSKKHTCPECGKKRFVRYIDTDTGQLLPEQYGRCDRESNCSYHLNPYKDGYSKMIWKQEQGGGVGDWKPSKPAHPPQPNIRPVLFIPFDILKNTRSGWDQNTFLQNLLNRIPFPIEAEEINRVIVQYQLGTIIKGYRAGAATFPFIDKSGRVRAIQAKQFDKTNHTTGTDWLHSIIEKEYKEKNEPLPEWLVAYLQNDTKVSCLFGEHLLGQHRHNPIALVEAPKTAIVGTLYFGFPDNPDNMLWLAVYNLSSLTAEKCKALQGREVHLFPDLSKNGRAFQLWSDKAKEFSNLIPGTRFDVSDLIEKNANEQDKAKGLDLADYLTRLDWRTFRKQEHPTDSFKEPEPTPAHHSEKSEKGEAPKTNYFLQDEQMPTDQINLEPIIKPIEGSPGTWDSEISELQTFFTGIVLPTDPVKLDQCTTIADVSKFIEAHFQTVKAQNGKRTYLPYLQRLQVLKEYLTTNEN